MKLTSYTFFIAALLGFFALGLMATTAGAASLSDWGKTKNGKSRFKILNNFNKEAVLDKETLLVWELAPGDTDDDGDVDVDDEVTWAAARPHCADKEVGGKKGWKLPSFDQLATLLNNSSDLCADPQQPCLPDGHPFVDVQVSEYWSAQTNEDVPANAWNVSFIDSDKQVFTIDKDDPRFVWCVRAGQSGPSAY